MAKKKPAARTTRKRKPAAKRSSKVRTSAPAVRKPRAGDARREREAKRQRTASALVREIGPLPPVANPEQKAKCGESLELFCAIYFPRRFRLAFARPHRVAIERMERCIREGALFACAMPRGTGKTTIAEVAVIWALAYGYRRFLALICATNPLAKRRLKAILKEIETNDLLLEDFPEICYPIRKLERIHNRTSGQTLDGKPTRIEMTAEAVILPTIAGAASSGGIFQVLSMEGAIRGLNVVGPDGESLRPDLVLLDDVQTRESAKSPVQTSDREQIVTDDVLGLAGPDTAIAAMMLCTVIYANDLSDRFLSPEKHPEWQGVRTKMLESFPDDLDLWYRYAEVRSDSYRTGDGGRRANEFYVAHREALDAGAAVSWPDRVKTGEISAIQSAMNQYLTNRRGFLAEFQNEPEPEGGIAFAKELRPDTLAGQLSGLGKFEVPREATRLTAMIDCGTGLLWYAVIAWDQHFGGAVIDYGSWPRQARAIFEAADPKPSLAERYPGLVETQWVYAGLSDLAGEILGRIYSREATGEQMRIERCLIDCGWLSQTIYQFCRQTGYAGTIYPSKGIGRTATARGVSEWKPRPGERSGFHWRLTMSETGRGQMIQFDPDAWKSALFERLSTAPGGRGRLTFWGRSPAEHEMIAHHCAAETSTPVTVRGATFDKWQIRVHHPDNHLWDCLVGAAVAASVQGTRWSAVELPQPGKPRAPKLTLGQKMAAKAAATPEGVVILGEYESLLQRRSEKG